MTVQRSFHTATLLPSGKVLLAGGAPGSLISLASAELYEPSADNFTATRGEMTVPRTEHTATLLPGGDVLIAGGYFSTGGGVSAGPIGKLPARPIESPPSPQQKHYAGGTYGPLSSAEVFAPAAEEFTAVGTMQLPRSGHTATLLKDGRVLVAGGYHGNFTPSEMAEIYDPSSRKFSPTGRMTFPRTSQSATLLGDGKVLLAGGGGLGAEGCRSAELYDPATGSFGRTGDMTVGRRNLSAAMLADGRVLVVGGKDINLEPLANAEIYDPTKGTFSPAHMMKIAWQFAQPAPMEDNQVLLTGAIELLDIFKSTARAQLFDSSTGEFSWTGMMTVRQGHTATLLGT